MTFRFFRALPIFIGLLYCCAAAAQERPVGNWRAHLPYNRAQGVATDGVTLYTISEKGFFTYNSINGDQEKFSKVEGMHETGTSAIAYDIATGTCIIAYTNSNIDLFRHHNFKVLPDLKNKSFSGSKSINHIYTSKGFAYLSTGLGIVVIDLDKQQVKETYVFSKGGQTIPINAFSADSTYFYAATGNGLYRISRDHPTPQVFAAWQAVDTQRGFTQLATARGSIVYTVSRDTVFRIMPTGMKAVYAGDTTGDSTAVITRIDGGSKALFIGQFRPKNGAGRMYHLSLDADKVSDSTQIAYAKGAAETADGRIWVADLYQGLTRRDSPGTMLIVPPGPNTEDNTGLYVNNGELWIAHGGVNGSYNRRGSTGGLSHFQHEAWRIYQPYTYDLFRDSVYDFLDIIKDPRDGTLYAGTYNSGLLELKADGTGRIIKQGALALTGTGYPATSVAIDAGGNLWVTQTVTTNELAVRTPAGNWYSYPVPSYGRSLPFRVGFGLLVDDFNQKWYYSALGGGVIVYNDGNTPENGADDAVTQLTFGKDAGNLPSATVRCLTKDRDGAIWIGTDNGIGIVNCPGGVIDGSCAAEQRVVQYDQFAGLLFSGESVRAIAVDGANRKWIGTTNGVWLLTPDAGKILNRFTIDNSPLPSNNIQKIAIDAVSGDVYIGTDQGLVSYRGTATEGSTESSTIQVFPNPVPADYSGSIAIRGLVTDADVRITDIAGQLIYRTKATGGQAVWNGLDYTGTRPQSGVYLIFVANKDGSKTSIGKMMMMH